MSLPSKLIPPVEVKDGKPYLACTIGEGAAGTLGDAVEAEAVEADQRLALVGADDVIPGDERFRRIVGAELAPPGR